MVSVTVSILLTLVVLFLINFRKNIANYWEFRKKVYKLPQTDNHFLFGHIWHILGSRAKIPDVIREKIAIYPPFFVVWLGPIAAFTTLDPKHIEVILGNSQYIDKPFIYTFLHPWLGTGLLTSTGAKWHSHRKFLIPAFHFSILETFLEVFAEKSTILVKVLRKEIGSKKFDINPYISKCTLDIICETAMGVEMNSQEETEESEYVNTVNRMTEEVNKRFLAPWLYPDFIYYLSPPGRRFKKYVKILHNYSNKVIRERKEHNKRIKVGEKNDQDSYLGKKKKMAFLDLLLQSSEQGGNLTDEEIREEVDTFMFEGHDTTSAAVCWLLSCLSTSYEVQEKVFEEQESIFKGSDRSPTMKDLNEMKYLERVIKESLRLFPSVPLFGRLLKQDVQMDGYTLPKGLVIGLLVPSIHRNPEYFPNPEEFNPDNFLPERVAARHPYAYIPFSAGPRNCIGQKFALLEEKMIVSYIVRHYILHPTGIEPALAADLILRSQNGFNLKITPRSSNKIN